MKQILFLTASLISIDLAMAAISPIEQQKDILQETAKLLQLEKTDLEKASKDLSEEQKSALKAIASDKNTDLNIRWKALVLASRLLGSDMRADVLAASKSPDWFMRSASLSAANEISADESADIARALIKDKALVVRSSAADVLATTGLDSDRELLWKALNDSANSRKGQSLWIRPQVLKHLAKRPLKKEISQFIEILKEGEVELQAVTIHALEKASDFQFGSDQDSIEDHRTRWLNWWETNGKTKSL
ncbi:MAG: hypothetical protein RJB66_1148 [Pseudomonadota bacterium]